MIAVDTSALMAIILSEAEAEGCKAALAAETEVVISAGTVAEALIVAARRNVADAIRSTNATATLPEAEMAIFITQGRFTREYLRGGLAKPEDRQAAISGLCQQAGGRLISLYFTLGHYDFIVISEMPDAHAAS